MSARTVRKPFVTAALTLVTAAAGLAPAARAGDDALVEIAWGDGGRYARSLAIAPGKFAELCGALAAGAAVPWRFEADQPLDFNIHFHLGKDEVRYPARAAQVRRADGTLAADAAREYCWMWTNKTAAAATVRVELQRP